MLSRRQLLAGTAGLADRSRERERAEAGLAPQARGARRPNVIVFLADDLGCHDLGCWGAGDSKPPKTDALAAGGARFTNGSAAAPVCAPSRAALLTGRYPIRAGVPSNGPPLKPAEKTIAELVKPSGYATGLFGKWH